MTNHECMKQMNVKEMTNVLYSFLLPWVGENDEITKKNLWNSLEAFLNAEVSGNGITTGKEQP